MIFGGPVASGSGAGGRIAEGLEADIVFLDGDPSGDLANLERARTVLLDGVYHDDARLRAGRE